MFTHLHAHSYYSFLNGLIPAQELPVLAQKFGMNALALTDINNVTGVIPFYKSAVANKIKPIVGVELKTRSERAVLLAKNNAGYAEICAILTRVLDAIPQIKPKLTIEDVVGDKSAAPQDIPQRTSKRGSASLVPFLQDLSDDVFIISSTPSILNALGSRHCHHLFIELVNAEREVWPQLRRLCKEHRIEVFATNNVYFQQEADFTFHHLVRAIDTNTTIGTLPASEHAHRSQYFTTEAELRAMLPDVSAVAFDNANRIAEQCNVEFDFRYSKFATFPCKSEPFQYLKALATSAFHERGFSSAQYHDRLNLEFRTIGDKSSASYYLAVWDMINYAKSQGFPYMGRGSGANSFVAYLLGISNVDPVKYNLQFERFLNPERAMPPDFDIDFSWKDRYTVIDYMFRKYGKPENGTSNAAMLCSIQTFRDRGATREIGKALGFPESELMALRAKLATTKYNDTDVIREAAEADIEGHSDLKEWLLCIDRLQQFPRHLAMHSGGLLLVDEPLTHYTALQRSMNDLYITQQDMHSADDWKLIKLDILATRGLGTYWDTMRMVEERYGKRPPIEDYYVAFEDEKTKEIIREGKTKGCFYIESPAMIGLLRKLRTDTFENLTAASSVIRPGVAQSGMMDEYIRRHLDPTRRSHLHPRMGELMQETYGIMVYQEDVLTVVHELAGISRGRADILRRAMSGKGRDSKEVEKLRVEFIEGSVERHGMTREIAEEIWRQIASFSGYSFCKAHSASYAVLSFQEAWLKVYYPTEFLCSVLNNYGGFYSHQEYIDEAKRLGIQVKLPDINKSKLEHTVEEHGVIRLGFAGIKGVTDIAIQAMLVEREQNGPYENIEDFAERSGLGLSDGMTLIAIGACDSFGMSRPVTNMRFGLNLKSKGLSKSRTMSLQFPREEFPYDFSYLSDYTDYYVFTKEREHLRYSVTNFPSRFLEPYRENAIRTVDLKQYRGKQITLVGHVAASKYIRTKKGDPMCLLNISDEHGMVDVVIWPELFKNSHLQLSIAQALKITGKIAENFGVPSLIAETIERLEFHSDDQDGSMSE